MSRTFDAYYISSEEPGTLYGLLGAHEFVFDTAEQRDSFIEGMKFTMPDGEQEPCYFWVKDDSQPLPVLNVWVVEDADAALFDYGEGEAELVRASGEAQPAPWEAD